jgi:four helix bundle protein
MATYRIYSFEKLEVWQLARKFRLAIYLISRKFPKEELFGLTSQLRRSAASVGTNLAEGSGKFSGKDQANFTNIAGASLLECIDHLSCALDLEYISSAEYTSLRIQIDAIMFKLEGLRRYQLNNSGKPKP